MYNLLVKFFAYADMLFMTFFIVAAFGIKVKWLSVASTVALLLFGCSGVIHAVMTRNGRPENYIYICAFNALVGFVALVWGFAGGWWN